MSCYRWQGWTLIELGKVGPTFSSFNAMVVKIAKKFITLGAP